MNSAVDVSMLCVVCATPCRERQAGVEGESVLCLEQQPASSSSSEVPPVTLASQLQDVLRSLLEIELETDGPSLVCSSCVSTIKTWQSLGETARASRVFFARQRALRMGQPEPESPAEPSVVQLNDDCLAEVLNRTDMRSRLVLQSVSAQWLRVGRAFRHLRASDFRVETASRRVHLPAVSDGSLESSSDEAESPTDEVAFLNTGFLDRPFHRNAFVRALTLSKRSVRDLDLTGLSLVELNLVIPHITAKRCPGVRHLRVDLYSSENMWTQALNILCDPTRLPKLDSVTVRRGARLNSFSLDSFITLCLPRLRFLSFSVQHYAYEGTQRALSSVLSSLPASLHTLDFRGGQNFLLEHFLLRLQRNPGLPKLTSLMLVRAVGAELSGGPEHRVFASVCQALAPQLTEFTLTYTSTLSTDYLVPLRLLTSLTRLQLITFSSPVSSVHVATVLRALRRLQSLYLAVVGLVGDCDALVDALCELTELSDLELTWVCVRDQLGRLGAALPQLRRLTMATRLANAGITQEQAAGLLSLVGRCTRLQHLHLGLGPEWGLDRTTELLGQVENVLVASRVAPPCPHTKSAGSTPLSAAPPTTQKLASVCELCPGPTPLCVHLPYEPFEHREELKRVFESSALVRLQFLVE